MLLRPVCNEGGAWFDGAMLACQSVNKLCSAGVIASGVSTVSPRPVGGVGVVGAGLSGFFNRRRHPLVGVLPRIRGLVCVAFTLTEVYLHSMWL
jgi:hypothetical protein